MATMYTLNYPTSPNHFAPVFYITDDNHQGYTLRGRLREGAESCAKEPTSDIRL